LDNAGSLRCEFFPVLEEKCRNARVALEENRSLNLASDFYIGEVDALRMRLPFGGDTSSAFPAIYRIVTKYDKVSGAVTKLGQS